MTYDERARAIVDEVAGHVLTRETVLAAMHRYARECLKAEGRGYDPDCEWME